MSRFNYEVPLGTPKPVKGIRCVAIFAIRILRNSNKGKNMAGKFGWVVISAATVFAATLASAQTSADRQEKTLPAVSKSAVSPEQRARLAEKLQLIDRIMTAAAPDIQARNIGLDQKRWLLESLYSAPLEQVKKMGVPGSFAATAAALSAGPVTTKALGDRQFDLVYRPLTPCRYIDTRNVGGPISGSRSYDLANTGASYGGVGSCNPAASAPFGDENFIGAIAINLTIVSPTTAPGFMGARPFGSASTTSLVNWYQAGPTVQAANAGVVMTDQSPAGDEIEFFGSPAQLIVDVFGIFTEPSQSVPQVQTLSYNLAAGATSAVFTLPVDTPVSVTGVQLEVGFRGVGQATILRCCSVSNQFLEWVGLDSTSGAAITQGFSSTLGTKIVFLDFSHVVALEVNDATSVRVHNTGGSTASGVVKFIY